MVNNPPGFTYQTDLRSIVMPYGLTAATCCAPPINLGQRWLVLDANRPEPLASLYANPDSERRFRVRSAVGPVLVLEIMPD